MDGRACGGPEPGCSTLWGAKWEVPQNASPRGILELAKLSDRSGLFGWQDLPGTTELLERRWRWPVVVAGGRMGMGGALGDEDSVTDFC